MGPYGRKGIRFNQFRQKQQPRASACKENLDFPFYFVMSMGGAGSKPEDVAKLATQKINYSPPLGAPNPVNLLS